jgi:uncharacterized protein (TIGR01777 family)
MKIVIAGGTGQVGQILTRAFRTAGHEVVILSRRSRKDSVHRIVEWNAKNLGPWVQEVNASDVVINLAGRSVDCRYNAKNRRLIMDSRVDSTRAIGQAIANAARPPKVWLQTSTATIYSHRHDIANDELTGIIGGQEQDAPATWRFSIEVARQWEKAAKEFELPATRTVLLRSAMTMSPDHGGIFDVLLKLVRAGLGGACGDGRQYVSWIHEIDFVGAVNWLIENDLSGPVNLASPDPLPNAEFMRELRKAWGIRIGLPASRWMLEVGAFLLRTETELILKSRRVAPTQLLESGFEFRYPSWSKAAVELCSRWRRCQTNTRQLLSRFAADKD